MILIDWLKSNRIPQKELARTIGVPESTVSRWCRFENEPGLDYADKIMEITNNEVGLRDLMKRGRGEAALG
jgi:transcriptional regulator with XRE-family HTH domain